MRDGIYREITGVWAPNGHPSVRLALRGERARRNASRAFYTALGHKGVYWEEPLLLSHVLGGIEMAAGAKRFNCGKEND